MAIEDIFQGDLAAIKRNFDKSAINERHPDGSFPIVMAINGDNPAVMQFLIDNGIDVNIDLGDGWTPLHLAFDIAIDGMIQHEQEPPYPSSLDIIAFLIASGADIAKHNAAGQTPPDLIDSYSGTLVGFNRLLDCFRGIIPDIQDKVAFRKKH